MPNLNTFSTLHERVKKCRADTMQSSAIPKTLPMLGLSVLTVELPFFVGMILVQMLVPCEHCRAVWREFWPVLFGAFPSFICRFRASGSQFGVVLGLVTLVFIAGVFLLSFRSRYWRYVLAASGLISTLLAALAHALIAA
jgi:hypothetical protein